MSLITRNLVRALVRNKVRDYIPNNSTIFSSLVLVKNVHFKPVSIHIRPMSDKNAVRQVPIDELLSTAENMSNAADNSLIIDVREPHEIEETGVIPGGINIPLGTLESAMAMHPEEFSKKYGRKKPDFNTKIIVSCRSGKRSTDAYLRLEKIGFKNLYNFQGGWLGYEQYLKTV